MTYNVCLSCLKPNEDWTRNIIAKFSDYDEAVEFIKNYEFDDEVFDCHSREFDDGYLRTMDIRKDAHTVISVELEVKKDI